MCLLSILKIRIQILGGVTYIHCMTHIDGSVCFTIEIWQISAERN